MRPNGAAVSAEYRLSAFAASLAGISLIVSLCFLTFSSVLYYWFTGIDAFPLILSNRLGSAGEIFELFARQYLSAYDGEQIAGSVGVRPVGMLTFAFDYWLWQLDPFGYHLTGLIVHALNSVLVFFLVRQLALDNWFWVGLLASSLFAIHPLHSATVPLMPARFDLLLCTFTLLSLIMMLRYLDSSKPSYLYLLALFGLLALGSKETGVILLPIAIFTALFARVEGGKQNGAPVRLAVSFALIVIGYLAYRHWVLGELGGYPRREQGFLPAMLLMSKRFFAPLVYPVSLAPEQGIAKAIVGGFAAILLLFVCAGTLRYFLRARAPLFSALEEGVGPDLRTLFVVSSWLVGFFLFYSAAYLLTGIFKPLYLYGALTLWCIVLSALAFSLAARLWKNLRGPGRSLGAALRFGLPGLLVASVVLSSILGSPRLRGFDEWSAASRLSREKLMSLTSTVSLLPDGATVFLINLPHGIKCGTCIGKTFMFEDYSVDSWMRLVMPQRDLRFIAVSTIWLDRDAERLSSQVSYDPAGGVITVQNTGGSIERPWYSKSGIYLSAEIDRRPLPREVKIYIKDSRIHEGEYYFYDFLAPEKIFALRGGMLVPIKAAAS